MYGYKSKDSKCEQINFQLLWVMVEWWINNQHNQRHTITLQLANTNESVED